MTYKLLLMSAVLSILFVMCRDKAKESNKQVKREVIKPASIVEKDTVTVIQKTEPPVIEKKENKYFLIAASFVKEANANKFRARLVNQGLDSEVIVRNKGRNTGFYKVSYKSFANKDEALKELAIAKRTSPYEGVWLLINE